MSDWLIFADLPDMINTRQEDIRDMYNEYVKALETTKKAIVNIDNAKYNFILDMARDEAYTEEDKYPMDDNEAVAGYEEYIKNLRTLEKRLYIILYDQFEQLFELKIVKFGDIIARSAYRDIILVFGTKEDFMRYYGGIDATFKTFGEIAKENVPYLCNFLDFNEFKTKDDIFNVMRLTNSAKYLVAITTDDTYVLMRCEDPIKVFRDE